MNLQEAEKHSGIDYRRGSPHLAQLGLYDRLVEVLRGTVRRLAEQGLPLRVLEIGAGHGGFTERPSPWAATSLQLTCLNPQSRS